MSEPDRPSRLWGEHERAPFPPHLRGRDIDGEDMVVLDADIAGWVSSSLSGTADVRRRRILARCLAAVEKILPSIGDEDGAVEYCERLREMTALAVQLDNAKAE